MKKYILSVVVLAQCFAMQAVMADSNTSLGCYVSINASPATIPSGQSTNIIWNSQGCATVWVANYDQLHTGVSNFISLTSSGSASTGVLTANAEFIITGSAALDPDYSNANGTNAQATTLVSVTDPNISTSIPTGTDQTGSNIISNGTVYFLDGISRRPYTSAGAFSSYSFNNWKNILTASSADLALPIGNPVPPMDGSLINDHGTVWVISKGQKYGFTSSAVFSGLGYSWENVVKGDASFLTTGGNIENNAQAHPVDSVINVNGTEYLVTSKGWVGIPSQDVFNSWGFSQAMVLKANTYDNANPVILSPALAIRPAEQLSAGAYYVSTTYPQSNPVAPIACPGGTGLDANGNCNPLPVQPAATTPPSSGNSSPSNAPVTVKALPSTQLAQCGANTTCFNANAQSCTLSEATITTALSIDSNASATTSWDSQIQGLQTSSGLCDVYLQLKSATVSLTPAGTQYLASQGETAAQIQQSLSAINASFSSIIGYQFACYLTPSVSVSMLQSLEQGSATSLDNGLDSSNCTTADAQGNPIGSSATLTSGSTTDTQRISDVREMALALELYYNDNDNYPVTLAGLTPLYLTTLPTAPTAEGTCTVAQNTYTYTQLQSGADYSLTFCLGSSAGGYSPGVHTVSDSGIQ